MVANHTTSSQANILIVDDTPNNLRLLAQMLEEHGYDVRTVTSGASALTSVNIEAPDLILLDIAMPDMNGYEVCERLHTNPQTADLPVIFISALDDALDKVRAFDAGGVDYISKPFQVQEVLARVHMHLSLQRAQRQLARQNQQLQQEIAERTRAEEQLQRLSHRLVDVQEHERQSLARNLHDEVGQVLTGLRMSLEIAARASDEQRSTRLEHAQTLVNELIQYVREMSMHLRPPMLDDLGLLPALFWHFERYTDRTGIQVVCKHAGLDRRFPPEIETTVYRIIQEALTNVAHHAQVGEVVVRLHADEEQLILHVEDHGIGFDIESASATPVSSGLTGIRERIRLLGGTIAIHAAPGAGTRLTIELPLTLLSASPV
jgi:signal transduction histidine kinase